MEIEIGGHKIVTPVMVYGDVLDIKWFSEEMLRQIKWGEKEDTAPSRGTAMCFHIKTTEDYERENAIWTKRHEDKILKMAEEIRQKRNEAGFDSCVSGS